MLNTMFSMFKCWLLGFLIVSFDAFDFLRRTKETVFVEHLVLSMTSC